MTKELNVTEMLNAGAALISGVMLSLCSPAKRVDGSKPDCRAAAELAVSAGHNLDHLRTAMAQAGVADMPITSGPPPGRDSALVKLAAVILEQSDQKSILIGTCCFTKPKPCPPNTPSPANTVSTTKPGRSPSTRRPAKKRK